MNDLPPAAAYEPPAVPAQRLARLAANALANLLRLGAGWLIVLTVPPILVRFLDKPTYATWMLVLQIGAYATLFDGGLQVSIGRFVARAEHANDRAYLGEILSSAAALLTAGGVLLLLLVILASFELGRLFHTIPGSIVPQASLTLLLVGGSLGVAFPASVLAGFTLGLEKNQINAVAGSVSKLAGAAGAVWAAMHHQGLVVMGVWTAAGNLIQPLIFLIATRSHRLGSLIRIGFVRTHTVLKFGRFCSAMMASQLGMLFISGLDLPIVVAYDFHNAGYYALATTASNMLGAPFGAILTVIVPIMSKMSTGNEADRLGRVLVRTTRLATALLALIAVPLVVGMPLLLRLWIGADYARHTVLFAELLVAAQFVRLTLAPYAIIAFSAGEQSRILISPAVESVVNLACSLLLVRSMGAAGVALGTLIGACVGIALHFWNSMAKTRSMEFRKRQLLLKGILYPLAWALPVGVLLAAALPLVASMVLKLLLLCGSAALLAILFWKAVLRIEDRAAVQELGSRWLPSALRPNRNEV